MGLRKERLEAGISIRKLMCWFSHQVMNWEIGVDMYTLICIKWITNENLLYKKINKILKFKK